LKNVGRNKPDALMKACADRGGLVGVCLFSPGLAAGNDATIEDYIDAMEHVLALVGEEHVGIGLDFSLKHARPGPYQTFASRDKGYARSLTPYATAKVEKPKGIQQLHEAPNITEAMARRGWRPARIEKILGQNWLRLVGEVWK
jgi:membrane dipeptidase